MAEKSHRRRTGEGQRSPTSSRSCRPATLPTSPLLITQGTYSSMGDHPRKGRLTPGLVSQCPAVVQKGPASLSTSRPTLVLLQRHCCFSARRGWALVPESRFLHQLPCWVSPGRPQAGTTSSSGYPPAPSLAPGRRDTSLMCVCGVFSRALKTRQGPLHASVAQMAQESSQAPSGSTVTGSPPQVLLRELRSLLP